MRYPSYLIVLALGLWAGMGVGCAMAQDTNAPPAADAAKRELPHIRIDAAAKVVDVEAQVVTREAQWLELIACTPGSREYEAILTSPARPSHIHLALLALGLEPGSPQTFKEDPNPDKPYIRVPATGPRVTVTLIYEKDGKPVAAPATSWVSDQNTKAVMPDATWLFTGSQFVDYEGKKVYLADLNGTILSLVNFGDDLLARQTEATNQTDNSEWGPRTDAIPPVGTKVTIRIQPAPAAAPAAPAQP